MEFRILGPLEARDGHLILVGGAGKPAALLALLLIHKNEVVASERLLDELWNERAPRTALKTLQTYVSQLRRALGAETILTRPTGYVLSVGEGSSTRTGSPHSWPPVEALAGPGGRRGEPPRGARPLARAGPRAARRRTLGAADGRSPRGGALAGARVADRGGHPLRRAPPGGGRAGGARVRAPVARGPARAANGRALPMRPPDGCARGLSGGSEAPPGRARDRADAAAACRRAADPAARSGARGTGGARSALPPRRRRRTRRVVGLAAAFAVAAVAAVVVVVDRGASGLGRALSAMRSRRSSAGASPRPSRSVRRPRTPFARRASCGRATSGTEPSRRSTSFIAPSRRSRSGKAPKGSPSPRARSGSRIPRTAASSRSTRPRARSCARSASATGRSHWPRAGICSGSADGTDGTLMTVDARVGRPIGTVAVGPQPAAVAASASNVWVALAGSGEVVELDHSGRNVVQATNVGNDPTALAMTGGGVWVANGLDGTASRIDSETGSVEAVARLGGAPRSLAAGEGRSGRRCRRPARTVRRADGAMLADRTSAASRPRSSRTARTSG